MADTSESIKVFHAELFKDRGLLRNTDGHERVVINRNIIYLAKDTGRCFIQIASGEKFEIDETSYHKLFRNIEHIV